MPASITSSHTCIFSTDLQYVHCLYLSAQIVVHLVDVPMNVAVGDTVWWTYVCYFLFCVLSVFQGDDLGIDHGGYL